MKLGPAEADVPTLTLAERNDCVVPDMFEALITDTQSPVNVTLEGLGAKQDSWLLELTAETKAPEDRSCMMCNPGPSPVHSDSVI